MVSPVHLPTATPEPPVRLLTCDLIILTHKRHELYKNLIIQVIKQFIDRKQRMRMRNVVDWYTAY